MGAEEKERPWRKPARQENKAKGRMDGRREVRKVSRSQIVQGVWGTLGEGGGAHKTECLGGNLYSRQQQNAREDPETP